jgi:hypothetical protein
MLMLSERAAVAVLVSGKGNSLSSPLPLRPGLRLSRAMSNDCGFGFVWALHGC